MIDPSSQFDPIFCLGRLTLRLTLGEIDVDKKIEG